MPGLRRANDFTSDSTALGSRSPSHDAALERRVETWPSRSAANPGFSAFAVIDSQFVADRAQAHRDAVLLHLRLILQLPLRLRVQILRLVLDFLRDGLRLALRGFGDVAGFADRGVLEIARFRFAVSSDPLSPLVAVSFGTGAPYPSDMLTPLDDRRLRRAEDICTRRRSRQRALAKRASTCNAHAGPGVRRARW